MNRRNSASHVSSLRKKARSRRSATTACGASPRRLSASSMTTPFVRRRGLKPLSPHSINALRSLASQVQPSYPMLTHIDGTYSNTLSSNVSTTGASWTDKLVNTPDISHQPGRSTPVAVYATVTMVDLSSSSKPVTWHFGPTRCERSADLTKATERWANGRNPTRASALRNDRRKASAGSRRRQHFTTAHHNPGFTGIGMMETHGFRTTNASRRGGSLHVGNTRRIRRS